MRRHDGLSESKVTKACRYVKVMPTRFFLSKQEQFQLT